MTLNLGQLGPNTSRRVLSSYESNGLSEALVPHQGPHGGVLSLQFLVGEKGVYRRMAVPADRELVLPSSTPGH